MTGYFRAQGVDAHALPHLSAHALSLGRAETSAKEYLPFPALLGGILAQQEADLAPAQFLIPQTQGAEADGQYARVIRAVLDRRGNQSAKLVSPMLETLPATAQDRDALFRALLAGDILYAALAAMRAPELLLHGMHCPAGHSSTRLRQRSADAPPRAAGLPPWVRRSA